MKDFLRTLKGKIVSIFNWYMSLCEEIDNAKNPSFLGNESNSNHPEL